MNLDKEKCNDCGHKCHCVGQGFYVTEDICAACDCLYCNHEVEQPTEEKVNWLKKQWQKFVDWLFNGFYKD